MAPSGNRHGARNLISAARVPRGRSDPKGAKASVAFSGIWEPGTWGEIADAKEDLRGLAAPVRWGPAWRFSRGTEARDAAHRNTRMSQRLFRGFSFGIRDTGLRNKKVMTKIKEGDPPVLY